MQLLIAMPKFLNCGIESHVNEFFEYLKALVTWRRTLTIDNKVSSK